MQLTRDDCLPRLPMSDSDMVTCFGDLYRSVCKVVVYTTVGYRDPQDPHWNLTLNAVTPDCDTACVWTANRSCLHGGDAVLVADWVAYQVPPKICGQKRILLQLESPLLTHSLMPRQHYEQYYDGVSTYRLDSDIPFPYFPYDGRGSESELFADPVPFHDKRTDALAVMMISNCDMASNGRLEYAQELMDHLPVHSYGECLHNRDFPPSDSDEYSRLKYASKCVLIYCEFRVACCVHVFVAFRVAPARQMRC
jgi:Fucosyltransferase, N-terminal/Glycosyltransferase family 10 (fucosyltransferase) C-term